MENCNFIAQKYAAFNFNWKLVTAGKVIRRQNVNIARLVNYEILLLHII